MATEAGAMGNETVWRTVMGGRADGLRAFYAELLAGRGGGGGAAADGASGPAEVPDAGPVTPVRDLDAALAFAERLGGRVERCRATFRGAPVAVVLGPRGGRVALCADGESSGGPGAAGI
jgi:predicted enzyme related to lactoylglutathione lyase